MNQSINDDERYTCLDRTASSSLSSQLEGEWVKIHSKWNGAIEKNLILWHKLSNSFQSEIIKVFYLCDIYNVHLQLGKGQEDWLVPVKFIAHNAVWILKDRAGMETEDWMRW